MRQGTDVNSPVESIDHIDSVQANSIKSRAPMRLREVASVTSAKGVAVLMPSLGPWAASPSFLSKAAPILLDTNLGRRQM